MISQSVIQIQHLALFLTNQTDFALRSKKTVERAVAIGLFPYANSIAELDKSRKTTIGSVWQECFQKEFNIKRGNKLDCSLTDEQIKQGLIMLNQPGEPTVEQKLEMLKKIDFNYEWDCKFTCTPKGSWMIPLECINHLCVLCHYKENNLIRLGVFHARPEYLSKNNQDKKKSILKAGKQTIRWLLELPTNSNELPKLNWNDHEIR